MRVEVLKERIEPLRRSHHASLGGVVDGEQSPGNAGLFGRRNIERRNTCVRDTQPLGELHVVVRIGSHGRVSAAARSAHFPVPSANTAS